MPKNRTKIEQNIKILEIVDQIIAENEELVPINPKYLGKKMPSSITEERMIAHEKKHAR